MNALRASTAFAWLAASTSVFAQETGPNILIVDQELAGWSECRDRKTFREVRSCWSELVGGHEWEVMIYHEASITGDNGVIVPDAIQLLEEMVETCNLGRVVLSYATDGVAFLSIGHPDLKEEQLDCVRDYERPGLWLREARK